MTTTSSTPTGRPTPLFTGIGVALLTIFDDDGRLDAAESARLARELVHHGVHAVVVAGSTGEAASLSIDERGELLAAVREAVRDIPVLAGTGAPSARQAAALTRQAADLGADGVLVLSPPGTADPRPYYEQVADAAGAVPVLAYHFPAVSTPGVPVAMLDALPVVGLKDSSGDVGRLYEELDAFTGAVYVGSADLVYMARAAGAAGAILAGANAYPEATLKAWDGDADAQRSLSRELRAVATPRPRALKQVARDRFGTSAACRMGG